MRTLVRGGIGRAVALAVGLAIGLRALQVMHNFTDSGGSFSGGMAQGTLIGLVVAVAFVGGLALWRFNRSPDGTGGPRFVALDAGMILGALVGLVVFSAA